MTDGLPTIAPLAHEDAIPGKFLNPVVVRVDDIHVAQRIDGHTPWSIKIAGTFAFPSPLREKISTAIKFLNAIVDLIRDVNIARKIHGQPAAIKEGSVEGPFFSPHEQRLAFCRVFLNAIVQCIRDIDVVVLVDGHSPGIVEDALRRPLPRKSELSPDRQEVPVPIELLNSMIVAVYNDEVSLGIARQSPRKIELAFRIARFVAPTGQELSFFVELLDAVGIGIGDVNIPVTVQRNAGG